MDIKDYEFSFYEFQKRENEYHHIPYKEEMRHLSLMSVGDMAGVEELKRLLNTPGNGGVISKDPLQNMKYLMVAATAIATRIAIEAGLEEQFAYNISDFYCIKIDQCKREAGVGQIYIELVSLMTIEIKRRKEKNSRYSEMVRNTMSYVYNHIHDSIRIRDIADELQMNENYLSTLFKKETGVTILQYVIEEKIEVAKAMLKYSEFSIVEISNYLSFSSQSHFNRTFKKVTGITPRQYKTDVYNKN